MTDCTGYGSSVRYTYNSSRGVGPVSQEKPRPNRIQLLRAQLADWAGEELYREALRLAARRARE